MGAIRFISAIGRMISCESALRPEERLGPIPQGMQGYRNLMRVAWPSMVEALLVCMVSFADTIMVGVLGHEAISAVGITNQPRFIMLAAILSLNVGVTAVVARRKGQNDRAGANRCMKQTLLIAGLLAAVLTALGIALAAPMMAMAGAKEDILARSVSYFQITMAGFPFYALTLTINAAQRGCGNTRVSMTTNLAANLVNIVFNYLLIEGRGPFPHLGVNGAALATSLGYLVSFLMAVFSILHKNQFLTLRNREPWRFESHTMNSVGRVASSALIEQACLRIGFFMYYRLVADISTVALSTHVICMNIISISFAVGDGLAVASSSMVGQSLGAERADLGKMYGTLAQRIAFLLSTGLLFLFLFGRYWMVGLFSDDAAILAEGARVMIVIAATTHAQTSQVVMAGCLRGAGDTRFTAMVALVSISVLRPGLTWILCYPVGLGLIGAWLAMLIDQFLRAGANTIRFRGGKWAHHSL